MPPESPVPCRSSQEDIERRHLRPVTATGGPAALLVALIAAAAGGCGADQEDRAAGGASDHEPSVSERWAEVGPARFFDGVEGTFVLLDPRSGESLVHDPERASTPFLPASTFKFPNTLIALETGVAEGPDFALEWDPERNPAQDWWPEGWAANQTLGTAFARSTVWFYQELARRVGTETMARQLAEIDYGNGDLSAGVDRFWLEGGFRVSAEDQVRFLRRFLARELPLQPGTYETARMVFAMEEGPGYRLSGKTGWVGFGDPEADQLGWFVGYVEREEGAYPFALNMRMRSPEDGPRRMEIARAILREVGLMGGG